MKYPTNIVADSIERLHKMRALETIFPREYDFKHILLSLRIQHKLAVHMLYKGTVGILTELTKIYLFE